MVAKPSSRHSYTFWDYLVVESSSDVKHEFVDGEILAMAGGTREHAQVSANVVFLLTGQLLGKPCGVHTSDLRVGIQSTGNARYPDVTVLCGCPEVDPRDPRKHTVTNPTVIVEVLSPSAEEYDRTEKLEEYKTIASLQEVVLVSHDTRRIEVVRRVGDDAWKHLEYVEGSAELASVKCVLPLDDVYRDPLADI